MSVLDELRANTPAPVAAAVAAAVSTPAPSAEAAPTGQPDPAGALAWCYAQHTEHHGPPPVGEGSGRNDYLARFAFFCNERGVPLAALESLTLSWADPGTGFPESEITAAVRRLYSREAAAHGSKPYTTPRPGAYAAPYTPADSAPRPGASVHGPRLAVSHEQVLSELLEQVHPVNFRELARLDDEKDKLQTSHYVVLVIEQVLKLAYDNSWGLCRRQGFLYAYNGGWWKQLDEPTLRTFLRQVAERLGVPAMKARFHGFSEQLYKQFLELASFPAPTANARAVVLVNLQNGTFEIGPATQLRPPVPTDFLTHQLPFIYEPTATAPRWQKFLDRVVPDAAIQQVLAEYLGYVFIPPSQLKLEKVLLLTGGGANGKSVFFDVVTALLGPENVSNYSLNSLTGDPAYSRAHLATKLVNYASELNGRLEADTFKQLVSGEPVEARLPYGQPFILTDYAKLIFNCNELPTEVEHTHAFFRRFLIAPFSVTIPEAEQNKQLAATIIRTELAGVFNWILAGLARVLAHERFTDSEAARQALDLYKLQSDTVKLFIDEHEYKPDLDGCKPTADVYSQYRQYCLDFGHRYPVARLKFVARLSTVGIVEQRRNTGRVLFLSGSQPAPW